MVKRIEMNSGEKFVPTSDSVLSATSSSAPQLMVSQLQRVQKTTYLPSVMRIWQAQRVDTELGSVESFFAGNNSMEI
ncbi:hypothetical protein N5V81_14095 [Escherichia coli]|nr:hypothetical protein [Escherichia coli]